MYTLWEDLLDVGRLLVIYFHCGEWCRNLPTCGKTYSILPGWYLFLELQRFLRYSKVREQKRGFCPFLRTIDKGPEGCSIQISSAMTGRTNTVTGEITKFLVFIHSSLCIIHPNIVSIVIFTYNVHFLYLFNYTRFFSHISFNRLWTQRYKSNKKWTR